MREMGTLRASMFRIMERESGPVSKSVRYGSDPLTSVSCERFAGC